MLVVEPVFTVLAVWVGISFGSKHSNETIASKVHNGSHNSCSSLGLQIRILGCLMGDLSWEKFQDFSTLGFILAFGIVSYYCLLIWSFFMKFLLDFGMNLLLPLLLCSFWSVNLMVCQSLHVVPILDLSHFINHSCLLDKI